LLPPLIIFESTAEFQETITWRKGGAAHFHERA